MVLMGSVAAVALLKLKLGHFDKELLGLDELYVDHKVTYPDAQYTEGRRSVYTE